VNTICLRNCQFRTRTGYCGRTAGCIDDIKASETVSTWTANTSKMPKLKKCPFCGSKYSLKVVSHPQEGFRDRYSILCDYREGGCGAEGPWYHRPEEAAWAWNQRT